MKKTEEGEGDRKGRLKIDKFPITHLYILKNFLSKKI